MFTKEQAEQHARFLAFYRELSEHIPCVAAGGCARDILVKGQPPKDYDLWLFEDAEVADVLTAVSEAHNDFRLDYDISVALSVYEICGDGYPGAEERSDLDFVVKVLLGETYIDIIKIRRPLGEEVTGIQIVETFDFPLNQFILLPNGQILGVGGHAQEEQHAIRKITPERLAHMQEKFPDFRFYDRH